MHAIASSLQASALQAQSAQREREELQGARRMVVARREVAVSASIQATRQQLQAAADLRAADQEESQQQVRRTIDCASQGMLRVQ